MATGSSDEMLRAARNQTLQREVNERIKDLNERFEQALTAAGAWMCECANLSCKEPIEMTLGEYEHLRSSPNRFAVLPGHEVPEVERIVEAHEGYIVVAKLGSAAEYVIENDPRQRKDGRAS